MSSYEHEFGGEWTKKKLEVLKKYLSSYTTALKYTSFEKIYIDAFAGTGYISRRRKKAPYGLLFSKDDETENYLEGSAIMAIKIKPSFDRYIFIEKNKTRCHELEKLEEIGKSIEIKKGDANEEIKRICSATDWSKSRAVLFLDPYGLQVEWETLKDISSTKAIDVWYLFPIGPLNRLLTKTTDPDILHEKETITRILGTQEWFEEFYKKPSYKPLFANCDLPYYKKVNIKELENFIIKRLESVFPVVCNNPLLLKNSKHVPLYLLCFVCSNPNKKAQVLALNIANYLLKER